MSESSSQPATQRTTGSFAALLTALTGSANQRRDEWDDSALADDVATISYEEALRAHRVRNSQMATEELPENSLTAGAVSRISTATAPVAKIRKTASITLRLTTAELAQLQERAATAQLSVSAYLRSCIFEAESLRTQVKEALAQMQSVSQETTSVAPNEKASQKWQTRIFSHWSRRRATESPCNS